MGSESKQLWPEIRLNVIQKFLKTVNLCIIKTSLNPVPADPLPHTGVFYNNWNLTPISNLNELESDPNFPISYIEALNMSR